MPKQESNRGSVRGVQGSTNVEEEELKRGADIFLSYDRQRKEERERGILLLWRRRGIECGASVGGVEKRIAGVRRERGDGRECCLSLQLCGSHNYAAAAGVLAASSRFAVLLIYKSASMSPGCCVHRLSFISL